MNLDSDTPEWQPPLILMSESEGHWETFIERVYDAFKKDFVDGNPVYKGQKLGLKKYPISQGKEVTFWHMTSTGSDEATRTPDIRRCERIRWPKPIIELEDELILSWVSIKKREKRIHLWYQHQDYLVVLAQRNNYILPWTAFLVENDHTRRKLRREYERWLASGES